MSRNYQFVRDAMVLSKVKKVQDAMQSQAQAHEKEIQKLRQELQREQKRTADESKKRTNIEQRRLLEQQMERRVRQQVFDLRQRANAVPGMRNLFQAFLEGARLTRELEAVPMEYINDIETKKYHSDTCKGFPVLYQKVLEQIGREGLGKITSFLEQINRLADIKDRIVKGGHSALAVGKWYDERLEALEREIQHAESLATQTPWANNISFGVWPECRRWPKSVIAPGWRNWFILKCAALIVRADGEVTADERLAFEECAQILKLTEGEIAALLDTTHPVERREKERAEIAPSQLLPILIRFATADGDLSDRVKRTLERLAKWLDVSSDDYHQMLRSTLDAHPVWTLDMPRAKSLLPRLDESQPTGMLERIAKAAKNIVRNYRLPEELPPEKLRSLRKSLMIPDERTILLIYEWSSERAALTDRHLHFRPQGATTPGMVPLQMITEIKTGITSCKLIVEDRTASFGVCANDFMEFVEKIIAECLKKVTA